MLSPSVSALVPRRWRAEEETPSTAIYVSVPLEGAIGPGRPLRPVTANAFRTADDAAIVVRTWSEAARRALQTARGPLHYVLDDDVEAGAADPDLPPAYRRRLRNLHDGPMREILGRAAVVHVPSEALRERMAARVGDHRVRLVAPSLLGPPASLDHHGSDRDGGPLRLLFPNTRSHIADWRAIWPAVIDFVAVHDRARLTTFLGREGGLSGVRAVEHRTGERWALFRRTMLAERYHVALLPGLDTAFNRARSHNKLLECAVWGAVPIVSRHLPYAALVERHGAGIVCGAGTNGAGEWRDAMEALRDGAVRLSMARNLARLARRIGDPALGRAHWERHLGRAFGEPQAAFTMGS